MTFDEMFETLQELQEQLPEEEQYKVSELYANLRVFNAAATNDRNMALIFSEAGFEVANEMGKYFIYPCSREADGDE